MSSSGLHQKNMNLDLTTRITICKRHEDESSYASPSVLIREDYKILEVARAYISTFESPFIGERVNSTLWSVIASLVSPPSVVTLRGTLQDKGLCNVVSYIQTLIPLI